MLILPAVDIRRGKCVRLYQGHPDQETVYSDNPIEMAAVWKSRGAKMLHVVDLDGAFEGKPVHLSLMSDIRHETGLPVEVGGGFRDLASVQKALENGIDRVILGTAAILNPELVTEAIQQFGDSIMVSIDAQGSFVVAAGWKEHTAVPFKSLAIKMRELGVDELLFTDTQRDGTLAGVNMTMIQSFLEAAQLPVTISGGINSLEDIQNLKELESQGLKGVVIGKALYDNKIKLEDALRVAENAG